MKEQAALLLTSFYLVVLLLILIIDLRQRRVLNSLALPTTLVALFAGLASEHPVFLRSASGAALGFLFFYVLYWLGKKLYGPTALGFGDVKLAMLLGAILGAHQILLTLSLGMLLAGIAAVTLMATRRAGKRSTLPYGAFMASAGIFMLLWTTF